MVVTFLTIGASKEGFLSPSGDIEMMVVDVHSNVV